MTKFELAVVTYGPRFQKTLGLQGFQVDGIFGNLGHESAGLTIYHEVGLPEDKGGVGWEQATGSRRRQFEAWSAAHKLDPKSDEANVSFIINELKTTEAAALDALRRTKTRDEATKVFMEKDERPGVQALSSRIQWAAVAEKARVAAESKSMTEVVPVPAAPVVAAPAADPNAALLSALEGLWTKFVDFVAAQAIAKGVPAAAVNVVKMLLGTVDIPKYLLQFLLGLAAKKA